MARSPAVTRSRVILLVEDNPDDVVLTLQAFEKSPLVRDVVVAPDGEQALDYLFATGAHADRDPTIMPEVVLLDLKLPGIDGIETLRRLRADPRTRRLPVVILSSSRDEADLISTYDLGANSFVRKPVDFEHFITAARQLGVYWLELNESPPSVP
jgi:two-component system response regulator